MRAILGGIRLGARRPGSGSMLDLPVAVARRVRSRAGAGPRLSDRSVSLACLEILRIRGATSITSTLWHGVRGAREMEFEPATLWPRTEVIEPASTVGRVDVGRRAGTCHHGGVASVQAHLFDRIIRHHRLFGEDGADIRTLRARIEQNAPPVWPWSGVRVSPIRAGGVPAESIVPKGAAADRVLLYLHGGGWFMGSPKSHRALVVDLARGAGVSAVSLAYRLAPEHPYPAALEDCVAAYEWLLATGIHPERMIVAGDSSGGNLALALMLRLRDAGTPLPAGVVLLSPITDLALTGTSHTTRRAVDPYFAHVELGPMVTQYVGEADRMSPYLSPLSGDLRGLPPMLIHAGDHEVLLDDAVLLGERATSAGVEARTVVWAGMMHVFQTLAPYVPEARRANREIVEFIRTRTR